MTTSEHRADHVRVAVLGTGIMGSPMARNLAAAGLRTTVWDRSPGSTTPLAEAGALVAASPAEAVRDADVVITMLPTAEVINSVVFAGGVAQALADGAVWAQMGTIGLTATADIASRLSDLRPDALFVDAPVSGSKGPAEAGQLLILASGPAAAATTLDPVFSVLGRRTGWLGEAGQGSRMKLAVNAYMSILIEGVAEALELAARLGIDEADTGRGGSCSSRASGRSSPARTTTPPAPSSRSPAALPEPPICTAAGSAALVRWSTQMGTFWRWLGWVDPAPLVTGWDHRDPVQVTAGRI